MAVNGKIIGNQIRIIGFHIKNEQLTVIVKIHGKINWLLMVIIVS